MAVLTTILGLLASATVSIGGAVLTIAVIGMYLRAGWRVAVSPTAKFAATAAVVAILWDALLTGEGSPLGGERQYNYTDLAGTLAVTALIRGVL